MSGTLIEIISAIIIYLLIPALGLLLFFKLRIKMRNDRLVNPPIIELFLLLTNYGGLLLVGLTTLFVQWSGMASLGTFYLILIAPILSAIMAFRQ